MVTHLTYAVAYKITSGRWDLEAFMKQAKPGEYLMFTHTNFFYSGPEWGKKWPDGKCSEFHGVQTACNCCRAVPDRNYAGYGTLYLMKSNLPRRDFVLFCHSCAKWRNTAPFDLSNTKQPIQYKLF